uniref:Uncharacterized protein n=1 Tax=Brassica campestris TaxID=3711 RepID=A0A3P6DHC6_BRACM|nr:unnamed protein product [Brassica rapa]
MKLQYPSIPVLIPAAKVPSYAARFKLSLRNLRKISDPSFLENGTPVIQAPESELLRTSELWKDHVVEHFHGQWVLQVGYWQADRCSFSVYPWTADGNLAARGVALSPGVGSAEEHPSSVILFGWYQCSC